MSTVTNSLLNEKASRLSSETSQIETLVTENRGRSKNKDKVKDTNLGASHDREEMSFLTTGRKDTMQSNIRHKRKRSLKKKEEKIDNEETTKVIKELIVFAAEDVSV